MSIMRKCRSNVKKNLKFMLFTYKAFEHKQDLNNKITISRVVIHPMSSTPWSYLNAVGHVWYVLAGRGTESPLAWSCNWACVSLMASPDSECRPSSHTRYSRGAGSSTTVPVQFLLGFWMHVSLLSSMISRSGADTFRLNEGLSPV